MKAWHAVASYIFRYTLLPFPQSIPVVEGVSKLSFQCGSRDAKFCVSTIWLDKLLILNALYVVVEGVSKLSFQCGSRDAKFCVSTIWLDKLLILNALYVVVNIETRHATSLLMAKSHFDTPSTACEGVSKLSFQCGSRDAKFCVSTIVLGKLLILSILHTAAGIESLHAVYLKYQHCYFDTLSTAIWVH